MNQPKPFQTPSREARAFSADQSFRGTNKDIRHENTKNTPEVLKAREAPEAKLKK